MNCCLHGVGDGRDASPGGGFSACVRSTAAGGAQKKGKGSSHVTSPWTPLISELARSSGRLVAIKNRSDDASSFLGALLWRACTAAGPACTPDIAEGAQQSGPGSVWHPSGFGGVEAEASHSGHFSSLPPFSCLLPVTRPLREELRVMPPPTVPSSALQLPLEHMNPPNPPPPCLHLNDSSINILQTNTHGGKLQRN